MKKIGLLSITILCWATITFAADSNQVPTDAPTNPNTVVASRNVPELPAKSVLENNFTAKAPNSTSTTTTTTTPKTVPPTSPSTTTTTSTTTTSKPTTSITTAPPSPITTTTVPPTTTLKPPTPDPSQGKWFVNYTNSSNPCIIFDMAIQIELQITITNATTNKTITTNEILNVPTNATAQGTCGNDTQIITLQWTSTPILTDQITFNFTKNGSQFDLHDVHLQLTISDIQVINLVHKASQFPTPLKKSYKCYKQQNLNLTNVDQNLLNVTAVLKIGQVQLQAFHTGKDNTFDEALDCNSETPDVVPIAVGCALAVLVAIVLIAYLVGRRRSQARGYLSM